jgi:hypothetical protein
MDQQARCFLYHLAVDMDPSHTEAACGINSRRVKSIYEK